MYGAGVFQLIYILLLVMVYICYVLNLQYATKVEGGLQLDAHPNKGVQTFTSIACYLTIFTGVSLLSLVGVSFMIHPLAGIIHLVGTFLVLITW